VTRKTVEVKSGESASSQAGQSGNGESANAKRRADWKEVLLDAKNWNLAMALIGLLPLIIYLLALPYMPNQIPAHYNIHGQLDRWSNKNEGLFLGVMSLLLCAVWQVCEIPVERSARERSNSDMTPQTTIRV
jgi:uncharacterized membrane protein